MRDIFEYRIVEISTPAENPEDPPLVLFMPQRGVPAQIDGLSRKMYWRDGVPMGAPTREMAEAYVKSMRIFDNRETAGTIVWKSEE